MKKLNKVLTLGVAGACLLTGGMLLSGCKNKKPTQITVATEEGVVLSRYSNDTVWTVTSFSQDATTINIPDTYNQIPVTIIADNAKISAAARTVTIGKNINTLSPGLFEDSANLTRLDYNAINASVNKKSNDQIVPIFSGKTGSEDDGFVLNIGVEVEQIPDYFMVTTDAIGNVYNNGDLRPHYFMPNLKQINFSENGELNTIGAYAFIGCNTINQTLDLPNSLENICEFSFAFSGVSGVLNLDESIKNIYNYAFWNTQITQVNFNTNINFIYSNAFNTTSLEKAIINNYFAIESNNFFGDVEVDIVINNMDMVKLEDIYSMAPNGFANFYITTEISQAEINMNFLENATYLGSVIISGAEYYHYV